MNWLFRTLNLLARTIFVIIRFDEEADIEDEDDYNKRFKIKKENIQNRLNDLIFLSEEEKESLIIVAVAANPFDLGGGTLAKASRRIPKALTHQSLARRDAKKD